MITLKRDGGWCVELFTPLKQRPGKPDLMSVTVRPPDFDTIIRWKEGKYPSKLSLLAHLSNVPEVLLRALSGDDVERVMMAFLAVCPSTIKAELQTDIPLATPSPASEEGVVQEEDFAVDQVDPRFPKADGPVRRFETPPSGPGMARPPEGEAGGLKLSPDEEIIKSVGV